VLDRNRPDTLLGGEEVFNAWKEYEALTWMDDDATGENDNLNRKQEQDYVYVFVSSAMRDSIAYPSPGYFSLALTSEIDNIIKAELVQASFPLTDPTVNSDNYVVRYSFAPHTGAAVQEIRIPQGSYKGAALAAEITRQMNQNLYAAAFLADTYIADPATGLVWDPATNAIPVGLEQFKVSFNESRQEFIFQYIDDDELPLSTPVFALHVQVPRIDDQQVDRYLTDDLYSLLGFNRLQWFQNSTYDASTNTYYILNTASTPFNGLFGVSTSVDQRYRYSLSSDEAADLRGNIAVVLDIAPLNNDDTAQIQDASETGVLSLGEYFGFVLLRDPAGVGDRMCEMTNNSYPIRKYYRNGVSRVNNLILRMRRIDGTIYNFGGNDYYLTIRLTVSRTQLPKPVFARGN
jgi:hypothetical protein